MRWIVCSSSYEERCIPMIGICSDPFLAVLRPHSDFKALRAAMKACTSAVNR
jgi:hypothetical protein